jgi:hypothetical protein
MKTTLKVFIVFFINCLLASLAGCSEDDPDQGENPRGNEVQIVPSVAVDLPTDPGEVGLVVDTREFFRKGYVPAKAGITFAEFPELSTILDIDPVTNLAILIFENENLSDEQKVAFTQGTAVDIRILDNSSSEMITYSNGSQILNDTNEPLVLSTTLPERDVPILISDMVSYLLQPYNQEGVITTTCSSCMPIAAWQANQSKQGFYFEPVADKPDTYKVKGEYKWPDPDSNSTGDYFSIGQPRLSPYRDQGDGNAWIFMMTENYADEFTMEKDPQYPGYVRFKSEDKNGNTVYLTADADDLKLRYEATPESLFRLITNNIDWNIQDKGTSYNPSITPPSQIDFAYEATIINCGQGLLTETVGKTESREEKTTISFTESLQLFLGAEYEFGLTITGEVGASVKKIGEVKGTVERSHNFKVSTNLTREIEEFESIENTETTEVSRTRVLEVPAKTGVEVYDAVRIVKNARLPFTQVMRIKGSYKDAGRSLSGDEILTQLRFNLVEGVPVEIGPDFVDLGLRGEIEINQMMEVETGVEEILDACN